jgi:putative peptidoglycan lipid II flippase
MLSSIFEKKESIIFAALSIAVFSFLAKILGVIRDAMFSHYFGASNIIDAYFAAFRIPDFIFNLLILGTFSVAFIPIFSENILKDHKEADKLASSILNLFLIIISAICLLSFVFIKPLVSVIAPGFTGETRELCITFTKILLLSPIFLTISSVVSSVLNTHKKFFFTSLAPIFYNLSIILGVLVFYPMFGPSGIVWGVVLGSFLHFLIQIPQLFFAVNFKYQLVIETKAVLFRKFLKLYIPRIFSMGVNQITLLIAGFFGSFLGAGSLAAFYYANNLQAMFLSLFAISLAMAVFPILSDLFNEKKLDKFKDVLAKTTVQILFFIIPISILMLIERAQIVRLILGIGQDTNFSFADTRLVSLTLGLFVISLFAQAIIPLFSRAFFALHNTIIPVVIGLATLVVNLVCTYFFVKMFGEPGLALGFSVAAIFNALILIGELHHKIGHIHDDYLLINLLKISIASIVSGAVAYLFLNLISDMVNMSTYLGIFIQASLSGVVSVASYLLITYISGMEESRKIVYTIKNISKKILSSESPIN